jgi:Zn-dependent M28 family amino/carboxypeptidase
MLELIRTLKEANYTPKRTILFVAWSGAEFHRSADLAGFLEARIGFAESFTVVAALQLEGVGAGDGDGLALQRATSERLGEAVLKAARRVRAPVSLRGRGLHGDETLWPIVDASVPSITLTWDGSYKVAHRPEDASGIIDPEKLDQAGKTAALALMVLAGDAGY